MSTSPETLRVALVQMRSGRSVAGNIESAAALIREAAQGGARYVQTPETTNLMELDRAILFEQLREEEDDAALAAFRDLARSLKIHLHVGSLAIKVSEARAANRGFLITPEGEISARYDKIHMFDVDLGQGESYRESTAYKPGEKAVMAGVDGIQVGLSICYDLRFRPCIARSRKAAPACSRFRPPSPGRRERPIGMCSPGRAPSRTALMFSPPPRADGTRMAARPMAIPWWWTPGAG